jgi:hypothetical protein
MDRGGCPIVGPFVAKTVMPTSRVRLAHPLLIALMLLAVLAGAGAAPALADPVTLEGVFVTGQLRYRARICSTCPPVADDVSYEFVDGTGANTANAQFQSHPGGQWLASGQIVGVDALPQLKAAAAATITHEPLFDGIGTYEYSASASAEAIQMFTYLGAVPEDYTVAFTLDGVVSGDSLESVSSLLAIYSLMEGAEPDFLGSESSALSQEALTSQSVKVTDFATSGTFPFERTGAVTFTAMPGGVYYLQARLSAVAGTSFTSGPGYADASHTFSTTFTAGNTAWLTPALRSVDAVDVPEPAMLTLAALCGAAMVGGRRRRA